MHILTPKPCYEGWKAGKDGLPMPLLNDSEIAKLFRMMESDLVERKAAFTDAEKVRQAVCAFANDLPHHKRAGVLFIGQRENLSHSDLEITDQLLQNISHMRSDGRIMPFPQMEVYKKTIDGKPVAVLIVAPSERPPVRLDGRTWIRVGPRRAIATVDEERRLMERQIWRNLPFDSRPFNGATINDLDLRLFENEFVPTAFSRQVLVENGRSAEEKLRALRLVSPDNVPTAAAILLLGNNPRAFLPGSYIQFLRIDGTSLTDDIVDQKEISGTLGDQIRQIDELMRINNRVSAAIGGPTRLEEIEYPAVALAQLVRNCVLHRNYDQSHAPVKVYWFSDRIEFHNSGGLFGDVTPETIWRGITAYRNPLLAEGLKSIGIVERFGFGIAKLRESLEKNKNPAVETEFVETAVVFIVRRRS